VWLIRQLIRILLFSHKLFITSFIKCPMRPTPPPSPDFVRIASIETQLTNQEQYNTIIESYANNGRPTEGGYSFGYDKLEFRILQPVSTAKNCTVIYWEVKGDITAIYNGLLEQRERYDAIKAPAPDGLSNSTGQQTERGILLDKTTNTPVGLVINPPYPRSKSSDKGGINLFGDTVSPEAVATLVGIGLALGLALWWLFGRRARHQQGQATSMRS
jgi:hypothetical protein